ncbi:MAG: lipoprotein NlpD [Gammaproteobacteria bacterium]
MKHQPCRAHTTSWPYQHRTATLAAILVSALLSACGPSGVIAPVGRATTHDNVAASSQGLYRVIQGDSLYSIAWRYGVDYQDLSRWNAIPEPYTIHPKQLLQISRPAELPRMPLARPSIAPAPVSNSASQAAVAVPRDSAQTVRTIPRETTRKVPKVQNARNKQNTPKTAVSARVAANQTERAVRNWRWPVKGKVIGTFGKQGGKGIDIAGPRGTAIESAAPGHVVYSGSGLRGYGKLIIVKHNKRYLSAYAHNDRLHVKEGDTVQGGQRIAEMGNSGAKSVRLHFEIRRDGQPVDPTRFLPR